MNIGKNQLELKIEKAVSLLVEYMPVGKERKKPILMHALRVGMYLYDNDYSEDVVLAGFLHDIIEWTDSPKELLGDEFGQHVLDIVLANTKDRSIEDKQERRKDYIERCVQVGQDALIVKAADTIDSYNFYQATENQGEIERSVDIAKLLNKTGVDDQIFSELKNIF